MKYKYTLVLLVSCVVSSLAQISITSPLNRAVYQRNLESKANLEISGTYNYTLVTTIQARLLNAANDAAVSGFGWTIIESNPAKGFFQGSLPNVPAGWYKLQVRAVRSGAVLGTQQLDRVGIGDVFAIAGQSNAQGYHNGEPPWTQLGMDSNDERIVTHDNGMYCANWSIPYPQFSQIFETTKPGTNGNASWLWGILGDRILDHTQFPVAFFNYGASGSSTQNWVESSQGLATIHPFTNNQFCSLEEENGNRPYSIGEPYGNFKRGLNYYNSMFGARAVLWHQGESDKLKGVSTATYQNNLTYIINKSRADFASALPWMVARASYFDGSASTTITDAQNNVVSPGNQIFYGPFTDGMNNSTYPGSRDGIDLHFSKPLGLTLVADGWNGLISGTSFLQDANPIQASVKPAITAVINASGQVVMSVPSGYTSYKWVRTDLTNDFGYGSASEGSSNTLTKTSGTFICWVGAANGNLQVSAPVNASSVLSLTQNGTACTEDVFLSDLQYYSGTNGRGPVEINKTNGQAADGDGVAISLKGSSYAKGLGVFGNSEVEYRLPDDSYYKFQAKIGTGDDVSAACTTGGVVFSVIGDGTTLYTSPTINRSSALQQIDINVSGKKRLILKTEVVTASDCNRMVWADAVLKCNLGDTLPPTTPGNLIVSDTLTKCLNFAWNASTDDIGVTGYEVFKNGVFLATLSAGTLSYRLTGLSPNENVSFAVRAFDAAGNRSEFATKNQTTPVMNLAYMGPSAFCVSRSYLPTVVVPGGGVFNLASGSSATVNATTGAFYSDVLALNFVVGYTVGAGIAGCEDYTSIGVGTTTAPAAPVISSGNAVINQGNPVTFTSSACETGSTLAWSFTSGSANPVTFSPSATQVYFAECRKSLCYAKSNEVTVSVIPDCYPTLNLVKPANNLAGNTNQVKYNASGVIQATNVLSPVNNIEYNSGRSITLNPGFTVEPGVIFKAEIKNCP